MKLTTEIEVADFLKAVDAAKEDVWLYSTYGDKYNLKSVLSRYVAISALLDTHVDDLELFCNNRNDEALFFKFFANHPEVL